jgi:hypothetical protein
VRWFDVLSYKFVGVCHGDIWWWLIKVVPLHSHLSVLHKDVLLVGLLLGALAPIKVGYLGMFCMLVVANHSVASSAHCWMHWSQSRCVALGAAVSGT